MHLNQPSPATSGTSTANLAAMFMVGRTSTQQASGSRKVTASARPAVGSLNTGNRASWQASNHATAQVAASEYKCPGTRGNPCGTILKVVQGAPGQRLCHKCASGGVTVRHTSAAAAHTATAQRHAASIAKLPAAMRQTALRRLQANNPALAARVAAVLAG